MIKKEYIVPKINVTRVEVEEILGATSNPKAEGGIDYSKKHDPYFDDWDDEEDFTLPKSKSLWEDD